MSVLHCVLKGDADAHWDGPPPRCESKYILFLKFTLSLLNHFGLRTLLWFQINKYPKNLFSLVISIDINHVGIRMKIFLNNYFKDNKLYY